MIVIMIKDQFKEIRSLVKGRKFQLKTGNNLLKDKISSSTSHLPKMQQILNIYVSFVENLIKSSRTKTIEIYTYLMLVQC